VEAEILVGVSPGRKQIFLLRLSDCSGDSISTADVGMEGVGVIYHFHAGSLPTMTNEIHLPLRTIQTSVLAT
jgi:hypothetical protein